MSEPDRPTPLGHPISRAEALRIARQTLERAERERTLLLLREGGGEGLSNTTDRLAEIEARYPEGRDLWESLEHSFEHYRSFFRGDAETIDRIDKDIRWLIAEVERLRAVLVTKRTPKQLMQRAEAILRAGLTFEEQRDPQIIAYVDQLMDEDQMSMDVPGA